MVLIRIDENLGEKVVGKLPPVFSMASYVSANGELDQGEKRRRSGREEGERSGNRLWWSSEQTGISILSSDSRVPTRASTSRIDTIDTLPSIGKRYTLTGLGLMDLLASFS